MIEHALVRIAIKNKSSLKVMRQNSHSLTYYNVSDLCEAFAIWDKAKRISIIVAIIESLFTVNSG